MTITEAISILEMCGSWKRPKNTIWSFKKNEALRLAIDTLAKLQSGELVDKGKIKSIEWIDEDGCRTCVGNVCFTIESEE